MTSGTSPGTRSAAHDAIGVLRRGSAVVVSLVMLLAVTPPGVASGAWAAAELIDDLAELVDWDESGAEPLLVTGSGAEPAAHDLAAAVAAAAQLGEAVEVLDRTTEFERHLANSDGTVTFEAHVTPQRVNRPEGWVPVDTGLRVEGGRVVPGAALLDVSLSPGGRGELLRIAEGEAHVGLSWLEPLPMPVLSGDTATYREVLPGVDLLVLVGADSVTTLLKVKTRTAAADPALARVSWDVSTRGVSLRVDDGVVEVVSDSSGEVVFTAPPSMMWDSPRLDREMLGSMGEPLPPMEVLEPTRVESMGVEYIDGQLVVLPDAEMLISDDTVFPVFIDPAFSRAASNWAPVQQTQPDTSWPSGTAYPRTYIRVGHSWGSANVWRSHMRFHISDMSGYHLVGNPTFNAVLWHSGACAETPVQLWRTNTIGSGDVTWNGMADKWLTNFGAQSASANKDFCPQPDAPMSWSNSTMRDRLQSAMNSGNSTFTFGLRAPDESDQFQWKLFYTNSPQLVATYDSVPDVPTSVKSAQDCFSPCTSPAMVRVDRPYLQARVLDEFGGDLAAVFEVREVASDEVVATGEEMVGSGEIAVWRTPTLESGTEYRFRARARNTSSINGPWSSFFRFTIDTSGPGQPIAGVHPDSHGDCWPEGLCDSPEVLGTLRPWLAGEVAHPYGDALQVAFEVWDDDLAQVVASGTTAASGGTTVGWQPPEDLPQESQLHLRVRATDEYDRSGAWSDYFTFTVDTNPPNVPTVTSEVYEPIEAGTWNGGAGQAAEFVFGPNGSDDVGEYRYRWFDGDETSVPVDTGESVAVDLAPPGDVEQELRVRSVDHAGNISEVRSYVFLVSPDPPIAVLDVSPVVADVGETVVVSGHGFVGDPAANSVTINGHSAQVLSAAPGELEVLVPDGATSGAVVVSNNTGSAASATPLFVPPPQLAAVDVDHVDVLSYGTAATAQVSLAGAVALLAVEGVSGTHLSVALSDSTFGTEVSDAQVTVYGVDGAVLAGPVGFDADGVVLDLLTVPTDGTYTLVIAPQGQATGQVDVLVHEVPAEATETAAVDGEPVSAATSVPGQQAMVLFDGDTEQRVFFGFTAGTFADGTTVTISGPDGSVLAGPVWCGSSCVIDTTVLPADGQYSILIDPVESAIGSVTVQLYEVPDDVTATVGVNAEPMQVATTVPGQNAVVSFFSAAGAIVTVTVFDSSYGADGVRVSLIAPDGTMVAAPQLVTTVATLAPNPLPAEGMYAIVVDPQDAATGSLTAAVTTGAADVIVDAELGGGPVTVNVDEPGVQAHVLFEATTGQRVSVALDGSTFGLSGLQTRLLTPDGSVLVDWQTVPGQALFIDPHTAPTSGTYTLVLAPQGGATGQVTVQLYDVPDDVVIPAAADGEPVQVATTSPGQNALVTFAGTAGQRVSVAVSDTVTDGEVQWSITAPDGTVVAGPEQVGAAGGLFTDPVTLPVNGDYQVVIDPVAAATLDTTVQIFDVADDLALPASTDGTPVEVDLDSIGQKAVVSFAGTATQAVTVAVTGNTFEPGALTVSLLDPAGDLIGATEPDGPSSVVFSSALLTVDGTYQLVLDPLQAATGQVTVSVIEHPADVAVTILDGPAVTITTVEDEPAAVWFYAPAELAIAASVTETTYGVHAAAATISELDGDMVAGPVAVGHGDAFLTGATHAAGLHELLLDPPENLDVGIATVQLHTVAADLTGDLSLDGIKTVVETTVPGQQVEVTFTGNQGHTVGVQISAGTSGTVEIRQPDGSIVAGPRELDSFVFFPRVELPDDGQYTVAVAPTGRAGLFVFEAWEHPADVMTAQLDDEVVAEIETPGHRVEVEFPATAGTRFGVNVLQGLGLSRQPLFGLVDPDGHTLVDAEQTWYVGPVTLPVDGTYTLHIMGEDLDVGGLRIALLDVGPDLVIPVTLDKEPHEVDINIAGQQAVITLTAIPGTTLRMRVHAGARSAYTVPATGDGERVVDLRPGNQVLMPVPSSGEVTIVLHARNPSNQIPIQGTWLLDIYDSMGTPNITSNTHRPGIWATSSQLTATWSNPSGSTQVAGYSVLVDNQPDTLPPAEVTHTTSSVTTEVPDGESWLHVRAVGSDGTWSGHAAHYRILSDATPPVVSELTSSTHPDPGSPSPELDVELTWTSEDIGSGVAGYGVSFTRQETDEAPTTVTTEQATFTGQLSGEGDWYTHVRAVDHAGNWGPTVSYRLLVDTPPTAPTITSPTHPDPDTAYPARRLVAAWSSDDLDMPTAWQYVLDDNESTIPDQAAPTIVRQIDVTLEPGTWWLHVRAQDAVGNWGPTTHWQITIADHPAWFAHPNHGQHLWGVTEVVIDCPTDTGPYTVETRTADDPDKPWAEIGTTTPAGDGTCRLDWHTGETDSDGDRIWPDDTYQLRATAADITVGPVTVTIADDLDTTGRLAADYASGQLDLDDYAEYLMLSMVDPDAIPPEYQQPHEHGHDDHHHDHLEPSEALQSAWSQLTPARQQQLVELLTPVVEQEPAEADSFGTTSDDNCGWLIRFHTSFIYDCRITTDQFDLIYNSSALEDNEEDIDGQDIVDWLEDAAHTYTLMGFRQQIHQVQVVVGPGDVNMALPSILGSGPTISMSARRVNPYLVRHEMFHAVQYRYITWPASARNNWWMEATAEWAAHRAQVMSPQHGVFLHYHSALATYLEHSHESLDTYGGLGGGVDNRHYGGFILAEYLYERFGGDAVIEETWRRASGWATSPLQAVEETIVARGGDVVDEITQYRQWTYPMVPSQHAPNFGFADPDAPDWRNRLAGSQHRPPHERVTFSPSDPIAEGEKVLEGGGAMFVELDKPAFVEGNLTVSVTQETVPSPGPTNPVPQPVAADIRSAIIHDYGGSQVEPCWSPMSLLDDTGHASGATHEKSRTVMLDGDCSRGILVIVNPDPHGDPLRVKWSAGFSATGAVLDHSELLTGVNRWGTISNCNGWWHSPIYGLQLKSYSTDWWFSAVLDNCTSEAWGIARVDGGLPADEASGYIRTGFYAWAPEHLDWATVNLEHESFTANATEATSVVGAPGGLRVSHHFHPSPEPHLIAVDVTVENTRTVRSGPLRYRRAIHFNTDDGVPDVCGSDYVTVAKTSPSAETPYLSFASAQPTLSFFAFDWNRLWGNDANPLSAYRGEATGLFTDVQQPPTEPNPCSNWPHGPFFELDLGELGPGDTAHFTLYFGAAPDQDTAVQAVGNVPAQIYALAKPGSEHGRETGEPLTGIVAIDGKDLPMVYLPGAQ
jgi:hypothetical protein